MSPVTLTILLLCGSFTVYGTIQGGVPYGCNRTQSTVSCRVDVYNVTNYLETLATNRLISANITVLTFNIQVNEPLNDREEIHINFTALQYFKNIQKFEVDCDSTCLSKFDQRSQSIYTEFAPIRNGSLPTLNSILLRYRKSIGPDGNTAIPYRYMFQSSPNLIALDLSEAKRATFTDVSVHWNPNFFQGRHIRSLNLSYTQGVHIVLGGSNFDGATLNFTRVAGSFLDPNALQILDLSRNSYIYVCGELQQFINLQVLDLSYNYIIGVDNPTVTALIFLPKLELIHLENQQGHLRQAPTLNSAAMEYILESPFDLFSPHYIKLYNFTFGHELVIRIAVNALYWPTATSVIPSGLLGKIASFLNTFHIPVDNHDHFNANSIKQFVKLLKNTTSEAILSDVLEGNARHLCLSLNEAFLKESYYYPLPCDILPNVLGILFTYDTSCYPPFTLPVFRHIKEFYINNFRNDNYNRVANDFFDLVRGSKSGVCVTSATLQTLDVSYNTEVIYAYERNASFSIYGFLRNTRKIFLNGNGLPIESILDFWSRSNLTELSIKGSVVPNRGILDVDICRILPQLEKIDLSNSQITQITSSVLKSCTNINNIDLSDNNINQIDIKFNRNILSKNPSKFANLTLLVNLSRNSITRIPTETIIYLDQLNNELSGGVSLDLSLNPIDCGCDGRYFLKWLHKTDVNLLGKEFYQCSIGGTHITNIDLHHLDINCRPTYIVVIIAIVTTATSITITLLFVYMCRRYRYRLITLFYRFTLRRNYSAATIHEFDAYLCYAAEDRFWTHEVLVPTLEDKYGFKLCVHYRDFPVGGFIVDHISDFMVQSKSIIILLTEHALQKAWFMYEVQVAQSLLASEGKKLIIIQQGKIPYDALPQHLRIIVACVVILPWPDDNQPGIERQARFESANENDRALIRRHAQTTQDRSIELDNVSQAEDTGGEINMVPVTRVQSTHFNRTISNKTARAREMFWDKLRMALYDDQDVKCRQALELCCGIHWCRYKQGHLEGFSDVTVVAPIP